MIRRISLCLLFLAGTGCAAVPGNLREFGPGYGGKGLASWYGEDFHGNPTASGEIYDMYGLTAAHRVLPLGTRVRVTHLENGRTVNVKVNDRGPFIRGRILDLSYGAARALGMIEQGTAPIRFEVIETPVDTGGSYTVQVGAFSIERSARELSSKLSRSYSEVSVEAVRTAAGTAFRVRVGNFDREKQARSMARKIERSEGLATFVTRRE